MDATGQPFDPNLHEAVAQEASDEVPEGNVVRQLRKGYRLKERLVRAALVVVSGGPA
jgi:molecular chaperone GrpE